MTESGVGLLHIAAIFGFDSDTQKRIQQWMAECDDFAAIWCGGTDDELFRFKQWWLLDLETDNLEKNLTLFIPPDDDFIYCGDTLHSLAERWGKDNCKLVVCVSSPKGIAARASQSLRLRFFRSKAEKHGLTL